MVYKKAIQFKIKVKLNELSHHKLGLYVNGTNTPEQHCSKALPGRCVQSYMTET